MKISFFIIFFLDPFKQQIKNSNKQKNAFHSWHFVLKYKKYQKNQRFKYSYLEYLVFFVSASICHPSDTIINQLTLMKLFLSLKMTSQL